MGEYSVVEHMLLERKNGGRGRSINQILKIKFSLASSQRLDLSLMEEGGGFAKVFPGRYQKEQQQ